MEIKIGIAVVMVLFSVFYERVLGNMGRRNVIAAGILLCVFSFFSGVNLMALPGLFLYVLIAVVITILCLKNIKYSKALMYLAYAYHLMTWMFPGVYAKVFPYNNLEEDIGWILYDGITLIKIAVIALFLIVMLCFLNHRWWKINSLWAFNVAMGTLCAGTGVHLLLNELEAGRVCRTVIFSGVLIFCLMISREKPKEWKNTKKYSCLAFMTGVVIISVWLVPILRAYAKPDFKTYEGEAFSYIAPVKKAYSTGYINERGEEVIPCLFDEIIDEKAYKDTYLIVGYDFNETGKYLLNERGEVLADEYDSYTLLDESEYVIVEKHEHDFWKCGGLDTRGNLVIPMKYNDMKELSKAEGIDISRSEEEEEAIHGRINSRDQELLIDKLNLEEKYINIGRFRNVRDTSR